MENGKNSLTVEDFDISCTLGTGSFGQVKLARLKGNYTMPPFALKVLCKAMIVKFDEISHIKSEKEILNSIRHPFIARYFGSFQDSGYLYFLMEYVCGGELFTLLRRCRRFMPEHVKFYGSQMLLALEYLHGLGIIYRDLKPENILIDKRGYLKLTDFGFAKRIEGRTYTMCGTPEYMSPEAIMKAKGYSFSSDWWAFGILLYEMSEGKSPFYDKNPIVVYQKIISGKFEFHSTSDSDLRKLIKSLLKEESKRLGSKGPSEIKSSKFFKKTSWDQILCRSYQSPWVPPISNSEDTQHFSTSFEGKSFKFDENLNEGCENFFDF